MVMDVVMLGDQDPSPRRGGGHSRSPGGDLLLQETPDFLISSSLVSGAFWKWSEFRMSAVILFI